MRAGVTSKHHVILLQIGDKIKKKLPHFIDLSWRWKFDYKKRLKILEKPWLKTSAKLYTFSWNMQNICKLNDLYEMNKTDESLSWRKGTTELWKTALELCLRKVLLTTKAFNKMAKITNLKLSCKLKLTLCLKFVKVAFNVALSFSRIV